MPDPPPAPTPAGRIAPGALVAGRYQLMTQLAKGGMAEVWEAVDEVLTRPVAVKILLPHLAADDGFVARFRHEAVAAARLSDPHIVSIYDTCSDGDIEAIVMELVRGTTLRQLLDERGHLSAREAVDIAIQVASALEHAHGNGLVHRDVKPANILLSDDSRVMVADFGIAKAAEGGADLTEVGQVVGTAKYLSPEQVEGGHLDARSDVYALGVVLYEMVCGRPPFVGNNATTTALSRLTSQPLRPRQVRAGVPRPLERIVLRAMARSPGDRHSSAAELRSALQRLEVGPADADATAVGDATAFVPSPSNPPSPSPRRPRNTAAERREPAPRFAQSERRWLVPAALIVVIAATLGVVGVLMGRTEVGRDLFESVGQDRSGSGSGSALAVTGATSFDPQGSGGEHDNELSLLFDSNPNSRWTTEEYNSRDLGGLKEGVGIVLALEQVSALTSLELTSPTQGWAASIYVAQEPATNLRGWGAPVASEDGIEGNVTFGLDGAEGGAVLVWITDLGESGPPYLAALGSFKLSA